MNALIDNRPQPNLHFPFYSALREGADRAFSFTLTYKLFTLSASLFSENRPIAVAGITLSLLCAGVFKKLWVASFKEFTQLRMTAKVTTVCVPVLLGLLIPLGLNSLFHVLTVGQHVNLLAMTVAVNFVLVPVAKRFERTLELVIHGQGRRLQLLRMHRDNVVLFHLATRLARQNEDLRNQLAQAQSRPQVD